MERFRYVVDNPEWHDQDGKLPIFIGGDINDPWFIVMLLDSGFINESPERPEVDMSDKLSLKVSKRKLPEANTNGHILIDSNMTTWSL
uniref:Uncharacterized protein n=1 Tax=Acrobeloides nanus TaxID=290746 RepID=A0A914E3I1_9BILA